MEEEAVRGAVSATGEAPMLAIDVDAVVGRCHVLVPVAWLT